MRLRDFLPWRSFAIETSGPAGVAAVELQKRIATSRLWGGGDETYFIGDAVSKREFLFTRVISYRNSFLPLVRAVVEPSHHDGARIRVTMRLHGLVIVFMTFWMTGATLAGLGSLAALASGRAGGLLGLVFPLFGAALVTTPFALEAKRAERI